MPCGTNSTKSSVFGLTKAAATASAATSAAAWIKNFKCPGTCPVREKYWGIYSITPSGRIINGKIVFGFNANWSARVICERIPYLGPPESIIKKLIEDGTLTKPF